MDEVCIKWVWIGSCVNRRFGLVGKKFGGEFFIFDVFYFNERFGFVKWFRSSVWSVSVRFSSAILGTTSARGLIHGEG